MKYTPKTTYIEENPFNTQIDGKIHDIRESSVLIQCMHDGECFLIVPRSRVPKVCMINGTEVKIFITARHGRFGIVKARDHKDDLPDPSMA